MSDRAIKYDGQLFRVEHQPIDGREFPYEFVSRIGAVSILPLANEPDGQRVLAIHNRRLYYGSSLGLPGGNLDGGFETPEPPDIAAERELHEETGYGYAHPEERNVSVFLLRSVSNTINYPRYFAVMRHVSHIGGADENPHEVVTPQPVPVEEYVQPLFALQRGELYPEVNAAFAKAAMELGREAVLDWLLGNDNPAAALVPESFHPWLLEVAQHNS